MATDFFTVEVLTLRGLITYYVLFFIHLESRRICLAGVTRHPDQEWMEQMARNVTMEDAGFLINRRYLLHDRDSKYCSSFRQLIEAGRVKTLALPPRSPNLNAYAERWVRSVKEECLAKLILLGKAPCGAPCATMRPTIMRKEITKAKTTYCCSLCRLKQSVENRKRCGVGSDWAAC